MRRTPALVPGHRAQAHTPSTSMHRGTVQYFCSCGWVGKPKPTVAAARREFEKAHPDLFPPDQEAA